MNKEISDLFEHHLGVMHRFITNSRTPKEPYVRRLKKLKHPEKVKHIAFVGNYEFIVYQDINGEHTGSTWEKENGHFTLYNVNYVRGKIRENSSGFIKIEPECEVANMVTIPKDFFSKSKELYEVK